MSTEPLTIAAANAEKISRGIEDLVRAVGAMPPMDELKQQMDEVEATLQEVVSFVRSLIELLGIPLASDSEVILATVRDLKQRAERPAPTELSLLVVLQAINAVGDEAARRGQMFPQTSDEQREDHRAVRRVVGMLTWYEQNTGCKRIPGWPAIGRADGAGGGKGGAA